MGALEPAASAIAFAALLRAIAGALLVLGACGWALPLAGADQDEPASRRYEEGPLAARDFAAMPPQSGPLAAFLARTVTDLRFTFRYRYDQAGDMFAVRLTEADVFAVILQEESWNRRPADAALLDHEQGHFDIQQRHALEIRRELRQLLATGKAPVFRHRRRETAVEELQRWLREQLARQQASAEAENLEYDRVSSHGRLKPAQAELRRVQQATLKKLNDELARGAAASPAPSR